MSKTVPTILAIITLTTTLAFAADKASDHQKTRPAKPPLVPDAIIKQFDHDGDGKLSLQEWTAIPGLQKAPRDKATTDGAKEPNDKPKGETHKEQRESKQERDALSDFQKFDTNHDGFVSREELTARAGGPAKVGENKK